MATHGPDLWPSVDETDDPLALLSRQHEAIRVILEWMPHAVDEEGRADPDDGRLLRALIDGALAWHRADEETVLLPRLAGLGRVVEEMGASCRSFHIGIESALEETSGLVAYLCRGEPTDPDAWRTCCEALRCALEPAMGFEDESLIPTVRMLLEADDLRDMAAALRARARSRPALSELVSAPLTARRISTISILRAGGVPAVVRRFADPPETARGGARVGDIMTRTVRCTTPDVPLADLVVLLEEAGVTGAPVVDERGRVLGVISQSDIVRVMAQAGSLAGVRVADTMMCAPFCVERGASIEDAAALLSYEGVHRLPVINTRHEVVGIVSALDLVRWRSARSA